jgi:hypothetical protein
MVRATRLYDCHVATFAEHPELKARNLAPEEAEAIRLRWGLLHPDKNQNEADAMPVDEALELLADVRARKTAIEREALEVLVHATRSVGKGNDRRSALFKLGLLALLLVAGLVAVVISQF